MSDRPRELRAQAERRAGVLAAALSLLPACLLGCASYSESPLDPRAHEREFASRSIDAPRAAEMARLLSQREGRAGGFDVSDGLSLSEGEAVALLFNAELRAARLRAGITQAAADNAGLWDDPELGVDLTRIVQSTTHPWKLAASIGLTLPISGRLEIEKRRAGAAHAGELSRVSEAEWRTRMDLRRAWTRLAALDLRLDSQQKFLDRVDEVVSVVDAMEKAHELTRTESRLFTLERAMGAMLLTQLRSQRDEALLDIKAIMGLAPDAEVPIRPGTIGDFGDHDVETIEAMRDRACGPDATSPALATARVEYQFAERTLELEIRKQYPDLHIGPGYGREDGQDQALLGLSIPLPVLNANRRGIAEATAAREAARARAEGIQEQIAGELSRSMTQIRGAREQRRTLEEQVVPLVDAQYADARATARLGEVNAIVLLESLKRQHEVIVRLIETKQDEALAQIRLSESAGPPRAATDSSTGDRP